MARKRTQHEDFDPLVGITSNFFEDGNENTTQIDNANSESIHQSTVSDQVEKDSQRDSDSKAVTVRSGRQIKKNQITAKIIYTKEEYDSNKEIVKIIGRRIGNKKVNQSEITRALWNILKHMQEKIEEIPQSKINEIPTAPKWDSVAQGEREEAITTLLTTIIKAR